MRISLLTFVGPILIIVPAFFFPSSLCHTAGPSQPFISLDSKLSHPAHSDLHPPPKTAFKIFKNPITHRRRRSCEIPHSPHSHIFPAHHHYRRVVISRSCHGVVVSLRSSPSCRTKGCVFIVDSRGVAMQREIRALKKNNKTHLMKCL